MSEIRWETWIETGATRGMYTLHRLPDRGRPTFGTTYVQNIGRTWERACKRADELNAAFVEECEIPADRIVVKYDISDERGTLRERNDYSDLAGWLGERLWFGKYKGYETEHVSKINPDYLIYIRDNFSASNPRMKGLIEKITQLDLGESESEREWKEREAKIAAEKKRDADRSDFIGTVGERLVFENMTVFFVADFEINLPWGGTKTIYISGLRDAAGNVAIYKGNNIADKGDVVSLRGTVKEHGVRDGVKQTIINRPHLLGEAA